MAKSSISMGWRENNHAIFYCCVAAIGALCYGYNTIYYTGIQGMAAFKVDYGELVPGGTYTLGTSFLSLSASIMYIGEFVGALITAPINDAFGRKSVFLCASVLIIVGAIVQVCSFEQVAPFYVGSILIGLGTGQFTTTCLTYISEVAPSSIRGPALMCFQFAQSCSQLAGAIVNQGTHTIAGRTSYRIPIALVVVLPVAMLVCLPFIPESPAWFLYRDQFEQAERSLVKINKSRPSYSPQHDLKAIKTQIDLEKAKSAESSWTSLWTDPVERRKLFYACGATFANQINGIQFWYTYGVVFAQSLNIAGAFTITTIICVVQIIVVGASVAFGNRLKRRTVLLICTMGILISLICVGCLGTTHRGGVFSHGVSVAIVAFTFLNIICYNFSIGPLSFTIAAEVAVGRNKNKITACSIGTFFVTLWLMVFTSPYLYYSAKLGPMLGFVYAGTTLLTIAYVWFCVGETTGRTNADIERLFSEKVPVREWETHVLVVDEIDNDLDSDDSPSDIVTVEFVEKKC